MDKITLNPIFRVEGTVNLPGSKSLSNRALLLAALAKGTTKVTNLLDSDDVRHMLNALKQLGVNYRLSEDKSVCEVDGLGRAFEWYSGLSLFLGNAGTAMRPLAAALCLANADTQGKKEVVLTGEPRMKERPIKHLVDALIQAGADVQYLEQDGYPPLAIRNSGLVGGKVQIDGSVSSQFLTALLMANIKTIFVAIFDAPFGEIVDISHHQYTGYRRDRAGLACRKDRCIDNRVIIEDRFVAQNLYRLKSRGCRE